MGSSFPVANLAQLDITTREPLDASPVAVLFHVDHMVCDASEMVTSSVGIVKCLNQRLLDNLAYSNEPRVEPATFCEGGAPESSVARGIFFLHAIRNKDA